ncbi:MAG: FtsQ-type POTRA domain-containing protein [Candidatus Omnitrophica bacterium]|nr:FtsQ-type POTRA domain-containing protein [Candidatus Omnitrophota bacterium]
MRRKRGGGGSASPRRKTSLRLPLFSVYALFYLLVIVLGLGFGVWGIVSLLQTSPVFAITQIAVQGAQTLTPEEVLALTSVRKGENLFAVRLNEVRREIERAPSIRQATIRRVLPGTLAILVDQRQPVAQVRSGYYYLVDENGFVIPPVLEQPDPTLPILENLDFSRRRARMGQHYESERLARALALLGAVKQVRLPFEGRVQSVDAQDVKQLSFLVEPGVRVRTGDAGLENKLGLLNEVYDEIKGELDRIKYVDLRFEDIIIKYK